MKVKEALLEGFPGANRNILLNIEEVTVIAGQSATSQYTLTMLTDTRVVYVLWVVEIIYRKHIHILYFDYLAGTIIVHTFEYPVTWPI